LASRKGERKTSPTSIYDTRERSKKEGEESASCENAGNFVLRPNQANVREKLFEKKRKKGIRSRRWGGVRVTIWGKRETKKKNEKIHKLAVLHGEKVPPL